MPTVETANSIVIGGVNCTHSYTHPDGCDNCPARFCTLCRAWHLPHRSQAQCVASIAARAREEELARVVKRLRELADEMCDEEGRGSAFHTACYLADLLEREGAGT